MALAAVRTFDDVVLPETTLRQLNHALALVRKHDLIFRQWGLAERHTGGLGLAFHFAGPPGTGKTICAEALAYALDQRLLVVRYAELESRWVGQTAKHVASVFRAAERQNAVLFFDEADAIAGRRFTSLSAAYEREANAVVNVLLHEVENFDGVVIFATNLAANIEQQLLHNKGGVIRRGTLGLATQDVDPRIAKGLGLDEARGAVVTQLYPDSAAGTAGVQVGDVILAANGQRIDDSESLHNFEGLQAPDAKVTLDIRRDGKPMTLTAGLRAQDATGRFQLIVTLVTSLVLVPGFIASFWGASVALPWKDELGGTALLIGLMAAAGWGTLALLLRVEREKMTWQQVVDHLKYDLLAFKRPD